MPPSFDKSPPPVFQHHHPQLKALVYSQTDSNGAVVVPPAVDDDFLKGYMSDSPPSPTATADSGYQEPDRLASSTKQPVPNFSVPFKRPLASNESTDGTAAATARNSSLSATTHEKNSSSSSTNSSWPASSTPSSDCPLNPHSPLYPVTADVSDLNNSPSPTSPVSKTPTFSPKQAGSKLAATNSQPDSAPSPRQAHSISPAPVNNKNKLNTTASATSSPSRGRSPVNGHAPGLVKQELQPHLAPAHRIPLTADDYAEEEQVRSGSSTESQCENALSAMPTHETSSSSLSDVRVVENGNYGDGGNSQPIIVTDFAKSSTGTTRMINSSNSNINSNINNIIGSSSIDRRTTAGSIASSDGSFVNAPHPAEKVLDEVDEDETRDSFNAEPVLVGSSGGATTQAGSSSVATGLRVNPSLARQRTTTATASESPARASSGDAQEESITTEQIIARREKRRRELEVKASGARIVGEDHVNYILAYNMLTGIRVAVSRTTAKVDRELTDNDFTAKHKLAFDINGNELTPSAKYDFKFKDYAPWVFRHLRQLFRLDPADYLISLTSKYIVSELGSPGKSGSFFYFSRDYRFIIKTIHHAEHKFLRKILKEYYNHVKANPNTLISQFYGLHRVKLPYGRKIHFIIMNNLFPPHRDIHQTFDLKGSSIGRDYDESKLATNKNATMKDLNWQRRDKHISLGPRKRELFIKQLEIDVKLLERLHIMDYSLLIGIHDIQKGNTEGIRDSTLTVFQPDTQMLDRTPSKMERDRRVSLRRAFSTANQASAEQVLNVLRQDEYPGRKNFIFYADDGGLRATNEHDVPLNEIYYLGVIDCLTNYSMVKKLETFWKGLSHSREKLSAVPPVEYGERFFKFISSIVKTPEQVQMMKAAAAAAKGNRGGNRRHSGIIAAAVAEDENVAEGSQGNSSTAIEILEMRDA